MTRQHRGRAAPITPAGRARTFECQADVICREETPSSPPPSPRGHSSSSPHHPGFSFPSGAPDAADVVSKRLRDSQHQRPIQLRIRHMRMEATPVSTGSVNHGPVEVLVSYRRARRATKTDPEALKDASLRRKPID
ncbi:hypothetical protein TYRP_018233 [Tyrophagus putrescentiae]|nr:hypothetical protein TYRP_018233 [Tyrophagus putrescentiae]